MDNLGWITPGGYPVQSPVAPGLYSRPCASQQVEQSLNAPQHEFIAGLKGLQPRHRGCVLTIGSFDGVHLGHQAILARLLEVGKHLGLPTLVMVFEPQPHEYFSREKAPARLMRLREKVEALFALGVDRVLCLRFDAHLRNLSAHDFIQQILVDKLGVAHLEIGDDFRFGCDRTGDFRLLQEAGARHGFVVRDTRTFLLRGERVSSTRVRKLLESAQLAQAAELLGRPFTVTGRVIYGKQLGRVLGVPTANIGLGRYRSPVQGVYAVRALLCDQSRAELHGKTQEQQNDGREELPPKGREELPRNGREAPQSKGPETLPGMNRELPGVANVGVRPTVAGSAKPLLEVHLLDYSGDLYGRWLRVEFCHKLRNEQKFNSLDELKEQIQRDQAAAREYFAAGPRERHF